ncbi:hypothetical protein CHARACLAT_030201, partial [Characodon lateralis]|nr:hypothetical protein [Characodon lateralis]
GSQLCSLPALVGGHRKVMGGKSSSSPPPPPPLLDKPWLQMEWGRRDTDLQFINNYTPTADGQQQFRILLHGPVGAGKSSFTNSVISSLEGKICHRAAACNTGQSGFTKQFNPESSLPETDPFYNNTPNVNDKVHVLVSVIDADKVHLLSDKAVEIIQDIRDEATDL